METEKNQGDSPEEKIIDGKKYRKVDSGYSIREYFSHSGPGWDTRKQMLEKYGVEEPFKLPDETYFIWEPAE